MKFLFAFFLILLSFGCSSKYTEYNSHGFGGGFGNVNGEKHFNKGGKNNCVGEVDFVNSTDSSILIGISETPENDVQIKPNLKHNGFKELPKNLNIGMNKVNLIQKERKSSFPRWNRYLNKQEQPRKTLLIIVGIAVILGLLGSILGLVNLLLGRDHIAGLIIGFSIGFSVIFVLTLFAFDIDKLFKKYSNKPSKSTNDLLKLMGLWLAGFLLKIALAILALIFALGLAIAR